MPPSLMSGAKEVLHVLRRAGHEAWLAGGCVRDHLLGLDPADLDVATGATPDAVCALFRRTIAVGKAFGVIVVQLGPHAYEVATFRSDGSYADGRRPDAVTFADAEADVQRRDFTVNGLLWDPETGEIRDLVGGREDLERRLIRAIGDADARIEEDALRLLRGVRFASLHDFRLEARTRDAVTRHAARITKVSPERIREELQKIATKPGSRLGDAWDLLVETRLAQRILPEGLRMPSDPSRHRAVLDALHRPGLATWLAVPCRDALPPGYPPAAWHRLGEAVARRLRCSVEERRQLAELLRDRPRYRSLPLRSRARLRLAATRPDAPMHEDLLQAEGDADGVLAALVAHRAEAGDTLEPPLIDGKTLLDAGFPPGRSLGRALRRIRVRQLRGELSDPAAARAALGIG